MLRPLSLPRYASPFRYEDCGRRGGEGKSFCEKNVPHNFAIVVKRSAVAQVTMQAWWKRMKGHHGDDQLPLKRAFDDTNFKLTRLPESFAFAMKSVDSGRFGGLWPRFSYLLDPGNNVTVVHSHDRSGVPDEFQDFCGFVNANSSVARMVFQVSPYMHVQTTALGLRCR